MGSAPCRGVEEIASGIEQWCPVISMGDVRNESHRGKRRGPRDPLCALHERRDAGGAVGLRLPRADRNNPNRCGARSGLVLLAFTSSTIIFVVPCGAVPGARTKFA